MARVRDFRFSGPTISLAIGDPQAIMNAFANPRNGLWGSDEWRVKRPSWEANDAFGNNAA